MKKISVVIPVYNEISNSQYFAKILQEIGNEPNFEILVIDGGSQDRTREFASKFPTVTVEDIGPSTRAARINRGIALATTSTIILHHPRAFVKANDIQTLAGHAPNFWGGFTHRFDIKNPILKFTSWYSNNIRGAGYSPLSFNRPILYLDHCIFAPRDYFISIGPLPDIAIFEDTVLSEKLHAKYGKGIILPSISQVSAIRFVKGGILKRGLLNQLAKIQWYLKINPEKINKSYQAKNPLNNS